MSFENKKECKKENNEESNEKINKGNFHEDVYVKNSKDYVSCDLSKSGGDGESEIPIDLEENDLNELALLGFFNDFALIDMGIHEFIREVYFEE
ncbi:MAG: hypothetical protein E7Z75_08705 [Methanobrevibacter olleyae]|uniref:Uncharacterized protein n=1 Tax=Methanobrevibacter olleyae TaxID=294671 RepID=A0A8T3VV91_METOL|nr:hypothetical protein [Methanobrevibacter olleyae]